MKTILFNPFEKYDENKLLIFGLAFTLVGSYLGYAFQGRYDGIMDLHFPDAVELIQPFVDNLVNILSLTILLFLLGKYINPKTRLIDILTTVMIARIPIYLLTFSNYQNYNSELGKKILTSFDVSNPQNGLNLETSEIFFLALFTGVTILFIIWFVILLFNGFKIASNSRGIKNNLLFAGAIILAEILSKIIFNLI
ncbi:hypothetical protein ACI6PS_07130 [Flavobacterium sp. PLA-1-15]|uniref:hypothetical protein n=1 Tax=Flavobacterium sp. PLA-1-15 TaxID=3380533 RepID=UPI003B7C4896